MNILFFDTETIGLPRNWKAPATDVDNWPRMMQLAFQVADETGKVLDEYKSLIQPDNWEVPIQDFWINHGYTTSKCFEEGVPVTEALNAFVDAIDRFDVQLLVAHNMDFDKCIVGAEMVRKEMSLERKIAKACTMKASVSLCAIPGKFGFKWPKLDELYDKLFNRGFEGAHDAGNDVAACRECFFALVDMGVMELPKPKEVAQ